MWLSEFIMNLCFFICFGLFCSVCRGSIYGSVSVYRNSCSSRGFHLADVGTVIDLLCTKIRFELDGELLLGSVRITQTGCEVFNILRRAFELTLSVSVK